MRKTIKDERMRKKSWLLRRLIGEKSPKPTTSSNETKKVPLEELRKRGQVVEISDRGTYSMVVGDEKRDVMVEFFDNEEHPSLPIATNSADTGL